MNVRTRLRGAFAVYIALLAGISIYHVRTTRRTVESGRELSEIAKRLRLTSTVQLERIAQVSRDAEKYAVTRDTGYLAIVRSTVEEFDRDLQTLMNTLELSPGERAGLTPLTAQWERATSAAAELEAAPAAPDTAVISRLQIALDSVHTATQALSVAAQDAMDRELQASARAERDAEKVTLITGVGAIVLSLLLSALLARSILKPLEHLAEGTRQVSAGRFQHRLTPAGNDELAQVAREFNAMTERLDELDRMKREFVSKISHDLKTPLSSMQETNSVLLDGVAGPVTPKQRQLLEITQESAKRLSMMLNKLLDVSRLEAGLEPERRVVDVGQLVRRAVDHVAESATARGIALSMNDPSSRMLVKADPDGLLQVFDNLLENALKFSPPNSQVRVSVADNSARRDVLVTVADEGPGIPDDEKERVFQRFYQTEAGRAVRARGVGLGLAICREIVDKHGGAIWVTDNGPRGSVFHVRLPNVTST